MTCAEVQNRLFALQDEKYRDFNARLIPTVDKDKIIGVRTPELRKLAKELAKAPGAENFLGALPHDYYEENNLHAFMLDAIKDYDAALYETRRFLPYIDNWATCDSFCPKVFKKNTDRLLPEIYAWLESSHTYTVRFALGLLMALYLDEKFRPEYLELAAKIKSEEYYINMMIAWYFATALAKQYESAIVYIEERRLGDWVHKKTIQKAIESYRVSDARKAYLKGLR